MNYKLTGYKNFKQFDTRWNKLSYRVLPACVQLNGCGATALADIAVINSAHKNKNVKNTRKWLLNNGYVSANQGTYWAGIPAAMEAYGYTDVKNHTTMSDFFKCMAKEKRAGIILFRKGSRGGRTYTTSGHFCAIVGYKVVNGKHYLYVCDPGPRANNGWICYETEMYGLVCQVWSGKIPAAKTTTKTTTTKTTTKTETKTTVKTYKGFDISYVQNGLTKQNFIDAKKSGQDFVIIRLGTVLKGALYKDQEFESKYKNATAAGLTVGVYFYSMAKTVADAKKEANYVLKQLNGRTLKYPVFIDYEDPTLKSVKNKKEICEAFCKTIEAGGYEAGVYASYDWLTNKIGEINKKYYVWLAQYPKATYKGRYEMHQYSSTGKVTGIGKAIDVNVSTIKPKTCPPQKKETTAEKILSTASSTHEYMKQNNFTYAKSGNKYKWKNAQKKKTSNCASYVNYTLQQLGLLPDTGLFYGSGGELRFKGDLTLKDLKKVATVTKYDKAPSKCDLEPGDVCTYKDPAHTQIYAGKDKNGNLTWYSYGPTDVDKKLPRKRGDYNTKNIQHKIRFK